MVQAIRETMEYKDTSVYVHYTYICISSSRILSDSRYVQYVLLTVLLLTHTYKVKWIKMLVIMMSIYLFITIIKLWVYLSHYCLSEPLFFY